MTCNKCNRYLIKDNYILNKDGSREELKSKQVPSNSDTSKTDLFSMQLKFLNETTKTLSKNQLSSTPSNQNRVSSYLGDRQQQMNTIEPNLSSTFNQLAHQSDDQLLRTGYTLKDVLKSMKSNDNETIQTDENVTFNLDNSGTNMSEEPDANHPDESSILMHENQQKLSRIGLSHDNDLALSYLLNSKNNDPNPDLSRLTNELTRVSEVTSQTNNTNVSKNPVNNTTDAEQPGDNQKQMIQALLNNNQITKAKLDEISNECKRINNNLKLFLIINVLNDSQSNSDQHQNQISASYTATTSGFMQRFESPQQTNDSQKFNEEETLVCSFKLKYFYYNSLPNASNANTNATNQKATSVSCVDIKSIENCLCVFTNHNITLLKITNSQL